MDLRRLRLGEWMAGAFGAVLLAATFLPWYSRSLECVRAPCPPEALSAWEAFTVVDFVLALAALLGLATWVVTAIYRAPAVPIALASIATLVSLLAVVLVVVRAFVPPGLDTARLGGLWLGLGGVLGLAGGAWLAVRDEGYGLWPTQDPEQPDWIPPVEITELPAPRAEEAAPSAEPSR